jgi:hypothetical protein
MSLIEFSGSLHPSVSLHQSTEIGREGELRGHCDVTDPSPNLLDNTRNSAMTQTESSNEIQMDVNNLYREEVFTDNAVGTLRRMVPVTADGEIDPSRNVQYIGSTQVLTNAGPLPLSFEIEADSLTAAAAAFGAAARDAFEKTMDELRELQRQQASSIVIPQGGMGGGMGGGPGGGMGGGKIQLP